MGKLWNLWLWLLASIIIFADPASAKQLKRSQAKSFFEIFRLKALERVVGGTIVKDGLFPWIVFIQANHKFRNNTQTSNLCGGSLIHPR